MRKKILFTAGGTGGHIFPALAILKQCQDEYDVFWVGSRQGIENKIIRDNNIEFEAITISGLRKKGLLKLFLMPFILLYACFQALIIILKHRPDAIVGFGGYVTFPVCLVGSLLRIPTIIHEQNSVAGLSNKFLAKFVTKVLVAYPNVLPSKKAILVGNPVRNDILNIPAPEQRFQNNTNNGLRVLVLGGSLGAQILNETMPKVFAEINKIKPNHIVSITHQVGRGDKEIVANNYLELGIKANVVNFIEDMADVYSQTDLIICRSGASTVSEICAVGIASIFIPYFYAVDNHQYYNAKPLEDIGAAKIIPQNKISVRGLVNYISGLSLKDCQKMAIQARSLAILDSPLCIKKVIISNIA